MLTGVWIEEGGRCRVLASRPGGEIRAAQGRSSWHGRRRAAPVVRSRGSTCEGAVKPEGRSGGPEMRRRRVIARNELTCGGAPGGELTALVVALVARAEDET